MVERLTPYGRIAYAVARFAQQRRQGRDGESVIHFSAGQGKRRPDRVGVSNQPAECIVVEGHGGSASAGVLPQQSVLVWSAVAEPNPPAGRIHDLGEIAVVADVKVCPVPIRSDDRHWTAVIGSFYAGDVSLGGEAVYHGGEPTGPVVFERIHWDAEYVDGAQVPSASGENVRARSIVVGND